MIARLQILGLLLLAAACSSAPLRVALDPEAGGDQPAVLSLTPGTWLVSLDGRMFRYRRWLDVEIPPGKHEVAFHYLDNRNPVQFGLVSVAPVELTFEAAPARRYALDASVGGSVATSRDARDLLWTGAVLDVTDPEERRLVATVEGRGLKRRFPRWGPWFQ